MKPQRSEFHTRSKFLATSKLSKFSKIILFRYTPEVRAAIGKYACQYDTQAASVHFSRKVATKVSKTSLKGHTWSILKRKERQTLT